MITSQAFLSNFMSLAADRYSGMRAVLMLRNMGMPEDAIETWSSPKGLLRDFHGVVDHFAGNDADVGQAVMRFAAGERDFDTLWQLDPSQLTPHLQGLGIKPEAVKALWKIQSAVERALPAMITIAPEIYQRGHDGRDPVWGEITRSYRIAGRPTTYRQFLPLAQAIGFPLPSPGGRHIGVEDPVLNISPNCLEDWIAVLSKLSGANYRLPTEPEWERATAVNGRIVDVKKEAQRRKLTVDGLLSTEWQVRYGNGSLFDAASALAVGGNFLHDAEKIRHFLRDGLAVSAWDFKERAERTTDHENVYERLTDADGKQTKLAHVGFRYFENRKNLRKRGHDLTEPVNALFRLAETADTAQNGKALG